MYQNKNFDASTLTLTVEEAPFKILQLTDIHFGFSWFSRKKDALAISAITTLVERAKPDLIVLTGDSIFPYIPKSGTRNNLKQAKRLTAFFDAFKTPYMILFGNHDIEIGSKGSKDEISDIIMASEYGIFDKGPKSLTGMGNYIVKLRNSDQSLRSALAVLDSNMYREGWFYSGFDCIREEQTAWCLSALSELKKENEALKALAFFHMPLPEFKGAYEKMKLGDQSVTYHFGSIGEADDYFGISKYQPDFFEKAVQNGIIKGMFCGHDHYNTLSLSYQGIQMTYGMSIDFLGYKGIKERYIQRGGTLITIEKNGDFHVKPLPLTQVVSKFVRGKKDA